MLTRHDEVKRLYDAIEVKLGRHLEALRLRPRAHVLEALA